MIILKWILFSVLCFVFFIVGQGIVLIIFKLIEVASIYAIWFVYGLFFLGLKAPLFIHMTSLLQILVVIIGAQYGLLQSELRTERSKDS